MPQLPTSQGRTSETRRYDSRDQYFYLEVGSDQYGFHQRFTSYSQTTYINEIVRLHGVLLSIISDRGPQLTSQFWKSFQKGLGTQVNLSTTFHPHMDGKTERTIQTLEDMLRDCVINFKGSLDDHLPLIEFGYNNSYHSSIQMALYEALYWRRCRSPVGWFEVSEAALIWSDPVLYAMEKVKFIRERLKTA